MDNPTIIRLLREICFRYREKGGKVVVITAPVRYIPADVEKQIAVVEAPLPSARDIYAFLARAVEDLTNGGIVTRSFSNQDEIHRSIQNLKGLTLSQIDTARGRCVYERGMVDPTFLQKERVRILTQDNIVTVMDSSETKGLTDVGGMGRIKSWLAPRKAVFKGRHGRASLRSGGGTNSITKFRIPYPKG